MPPGTPSLHFGSVPFSVLSESCVALDSQMHDLSAVSGVVGDDLKMIEGYARQNARANSTFCTRLHEFS